MKTPSSKSIGIFALAMLMTSAVDAVRNLPTTALFGSSLIFFFIFSAIVFLIPVALISAELSAAFTDKGGIYEWTRMAFGESLAFLAIWLQWINTMVWLPTVLSFIAGTVAFVIDPSLASNKLFLISIILIIMWMITLINLKGLQTSARFASLCTVFGMLIPMAMIIAMGALWLCLGKPIQIQFTPEDLIPHLGSTHNWMSLTAIMAAFLGMELASVHVRDVKNAKKIFPKALTVSVGIILFTMISGSLAIAFVIPSNQINLVDGVMQAFNDFFAAYHMKWFINIAAIMLLIGSLGNMVNWIISPAKGLLQAAQHHYLPKFFAKENKNGVAQNMLLTQAVLVSLFCFAFLLMPSVNASYWLLTDLSTQLYMLMYVILFLSALAIYHQYPNQKKPFKVPGGTPGYWIMCLLGLIGCGITLVVGFFPPEGMNVGGTTHYEIMFTAGILLMIAPCLLAFLYKKLNK